MNSGSPRHLVFVITGLEPGGAERALTQIALRIDRNRFKPVVIALRPPPPTEQRELVQQLTAANIPVEFLGARSAWQFPSVIWKLAQRLKSLRPASVQSFLYHANVAAAVAGKWSGVPVAAGVRVADPRRMRQQTERWLSPLLKKFVCVSQSVADFCERTCRFPTDKLLVIPNGVDVARFRDAAPADRLTFGLPADRRFLICVGRLDLQKGHDWLLPQLPRVFESRPDYDLLLVGDGPERARLQAQVQSLGLSERVHFLGWQAQIPALLKLSDLLLLPSRWEGMPNVLLEAMAAGLPVVTTQVEGAEEILGPLSAEQLVPRDNAAAFAENVLALLGNEVLRRDLGIANQNRVAEHFSLAVIATAYGELHARLTNS